METVTLKRINMSPRNETSSNRTEQQTGTTCSEKTSIPADILILLIALLGIAANAVVLIVIFRTKKLRKPIYIGISMLAIPDMIFLTGKLITLFLTYINAQNTLGANLVNSVVLTAYFTSTCHVVLLSLQQYFYLAHPLKSHVWFTVRKMRYVSLVAWLVSAVVAILYMCILIFFKEGIPKESRTIFLRVITNLSIAVPVIALTVLYVLKRVALKTLLSDGRSVAVKRMSRLVGFVVIAYLVSTTPINIRDIMKYSFDFCPKTGLEFFFNDACFVLLHCNFTINPFIYFIMTQKCRQACNIRRMESLICMKDTEDSSQRETRSTSV